MEGPVNIESKEIADSLKLEASAVPPSIERKFIDGCHSLANVLLEQYSSFIPPQTRQRVSEKIDDTLIVDDLNGMLEAWAGGENPRVEVAGAAILKPEDIIVLPHHPDLVKQLPEADRQAFLESLEPKAEDLGLSPDAVLNALYMWKLAGHEVAHLLESEYMPESFLELGADYYGNLAFEKHTGGVIMYDANEKARIDFYQYLANKYGNDIHKLFFGTNKNPITKFRVMRELDQSTIIKLHNGRKWLHGTHKVSVS